MTSGPESSSEEDELARVLEGYLADVEAGRSVDLARLMAENPSIAGRLRACLVSLRLVDRASYSLAAVAGSPLDQGEPERRLGDFRLLREVGRGGMGVVYEAEQISLRRRQGFERCLSLKCPWFSGAAWRLRAWGLAPKFRREGACARRLRRGTRPQGLCRGHDADQQRPAWRRQ